MNSQGNDEISKKLTKLIMKQLLPKLLEKDVFFGGFLEKVWDLILWSQDVEFAINKDTYVSDSIKQLGVEFQDVHKTSERKIIFPSKDKCFNFTALIGECKLPGATYFLYRKTSGDQYLLRLDDYSFSIIPSQELPPNFVDNLVEAYWRYWITIQYANL